MLLASRLKLELELCCGESSISDYQPNKNIAIAIIRNEPEHNILSCLVWIIVTADNTHW